ncbi:MAG: SurA N-terminal domain-containing protein [Acidobacteriia bacterium]|nr:SurA N-terminal domain-containing protein [Terriglobia bacterium]
MRAWQQLVLVLALLAPLAVAGEVVERIVARVHDRVILQSELDDALRYQALLAGRDPDRFTGDERNQAIERLVDQMLIKEQIDRRTFARASKEDIARQVADIRRRLPGAQDDQSWRQLLARYGLAEADVDELVAVQVDILRYEDARFRPTIHIDERSIKTYYLEQFIPQLHKAGAQEVPLQDVSGKIEEILIQQRISESVDSWLSRLREEAHLPRSKEVKLQ